MAHKARVVCPNDESLRKAVLYGGPDDKFEDEGDEEWYEAEYRSYVAISRHLENCEICGAKSRQMERRLRRQRRVNLATVL